MLTLTVIYLLTLLSAVVVGLIRYRKMRPVYLRLLWATMACMLLKEGGGMLTFNTRHPDNTWWFNLFMPLEYIFPALFYALYFRSRFTWFYFALSLVVILLMAIWFYGVHEINMYTAFAVSVCLAPWMLLYYRDLFRNPQAPDLVKDPLFWASTGLLIYHICSLAAFWAFSMFTPIYPELATKFRITLMTLAIINYIFIIISFLCRFPKKTSSSA